MQTEFDYIGTQSSSALPDTYDYPAAAASSLAMTGINAHTRSFPVGTFRYTVLKRAMDILLVLLFFPVLLLVCGGLALMVMLTSRGPVFFSHRRIRRNGTFFSMWKFRTMCANSADVLEEYLARHPEARAEWNTTHKLRYDPRVTPFGNFLRRFSMDELPQVWNVLNGQMSLVGPRPIVAAEVEKYGDCFSCYCRVKPGMTGLWQISGRSQVTYEERVALDCKYVNEWSLWHDISILLKTVRCVVNSNGAY
jgi:Undecaprenyl-phosphate galactose phosphotransferase WbaP